MREPVEGSSAAPPDTVPKAGTLWAMRLLQIGPRTPRSECVLHPDRFIMPAAWLRSCLTAASTCAGLSLINRLAASHLRSIPGDISPLGKLCSSHRAVLWLFTNPDAHSTQLLPGTSVPNDVTSGRAASLLPRHSSS